MKCDHDQWIPKVAVIDKANGERIVSGEGQPTKTAAWIEAKRLVAEYGGAVEWMGVVLRREK